MSGYDQALEAQDRQRRAGYRPENGLVGQGLAFERTRRITGYLVGTLERFNTAKRCEEQDRLCHGCLETRPGPEERNGKPVEVQ